MSRSVIVLALAEKHVSMDEFARFFGEKYFLSKRATGLTSFQIRCRIGGAEEDRTPDLRIANATLSQLSYGPIRQVNINSFRNSSSSGCTGKICPGKILVS